MTWTTVKSNVLVPVDDKESAASAIHAARQYLDSSDKLHLLTVVVPPSPAAPGAIWGQIDLNSVIGATENYLKEIAKQNAVEDAQLHVRVGTAGPEIARFAEEEGVELIIIPSQGRRGVERLLMGSTAETVVRRAKCDVLVLHPTKA